MSEQQTPALEKAFLDMPAMITIVRRLFDKIEEPRSRKRPTHSLTDCLVSGLAMFHFRDGSMLQFEEACKKDSRRRNLRRLFGLKGDPPSDTTMRRRLDKVDPDEVRPAFSAIWHAAEERGMLKPFDVYGGRVAVALDATQHFESTKINCGNCLRRLIDEVMHYSHQALLAAAVSVDEKRALPLDVEPIVNGDGNRKQDCEAKAATRLLPRLREFYPSMRPVILCDALYANGPMLRRIAEHDMEFITTVKEPHKDCQIFRVCGILPHCPLGGKNFSFFSILSFFHRLL